MHINILYHNRMISRIFGSYKLQLTTSKVSRNYSEGKNKQRAAALMFFI